jgi:predicted Zn-dependent protease
VITGRWGSALALLLGLLVAGSASAKLGQKKSSIVIGATEEREIGAKMAAQMRGEKQVVLDKTIVDYVNRTGQNIARLSDRPEMACRFSVLEEKTPQAFAMPGGYIYISTGLLKALDTQSQLAGVLAHEIGHVVAGHGLKQIQDRLEYNALSTLVLGGASKESTLVVLNAAIAAVMAGYDKNMEAEADSYGAMYMARSGMNPEGMAQAMDKVAKLSQDGEGFWESLDKKHAPAAKRAAGVRGEIKDKGLDAGLPSDPQPYRTVKARVP